MRQTRLLTLLVLLMTAATGAWAQQTLTVYDGTFEDNTSPANIGYSDQYTRSQTVIPSTALTAMKGCDITAMTFYCNGMPASGTIDYSFDVYLKEVSYTAFAESPTFEPKSSCTSVHQGKLSISNYALTITFSKPFHYNGGNLLIGMENTSKVTYYQITFLGRDTGSSLSNISIHHNTDLASATSIAKRYYIPKTTFTYVVPTYTVNLNDGALNPTTWTGKVGTGSFGALPLEDVSEGETVTLKYDGTREVKSITATVVEDSRLLVPLTMEVTEAGNIKVTISNGDPLTMKYSLDGGATKTAITTTTFIPSENGSLPVGTKVQFYGDGTNNAVYGKSPVVEISGGTAKVKAYGNIMSLIDENNFATNKTLKESWNFYKLFNGNENLTDASGLLLPATKVTQACYSYMFYNCSNMTAGPAELPAMELEGSCYEYMFSGCTSLTAGPVLPAPVLPEACYYYMFYNCKNLASVTCLATSGIYSNYSTAFWLKFAGDDVPTEIEKTVTVANDQLYWPSDANGIPTGWTRVNAE